MAKTILVTGGNGQLGKELQHFAPQYPFNFIFTDTDELDITKSSQLRSFFKKRDIDFCINAAAYTAVDNAESDRELCNAVNIEGSANLAEVCDAYDAKLIHISTDFVFDGERHTPYDENAYANPLNIYGRSKFEGEQVILDTLSDAIIIRTSWLYSSFGSNFVKTMINLSKKLDKLSVVEDQIGTQHMHATWQRQPCILFNQIGLKEYITLAMRALPLGMTLPMLFSASKTLLLI